MEVDFRVIDQVNKLKVDQLKPLTHASLQLKWKTRKYMKIYEEKKIFKNNRYFCSPASIRWFQVEKYSFAEGLKRIYFECCVLIIYLKWVSFYYIEISVILLLCYISCCVYVLYAVLSSPLNMYFKNAHALETHVYLWLNKITFREILLPIKFEKYQFQ